MKNRSLSEDICFRSVRRCSPTYLFEEYCQADNQHRDQRKGLGLTIAG